MEKYADCQLQVVRESGTDRLLGYVIQSPGFRHELSEFERELRAEGVECSLDQKPFPHVQIPHAEGVWSKVSSVFHRVAMAE